MKLITQETPKHYKFAKIKISKLYWEPQCYQKEMSLKLLGSL